MMYENGITRIQRCFSEKKVFAAYLTAGQTGMENTVEVARALLKGGINLLEIGVPFSDPVADGPVIQQASEQALQHNINLSAIFELVKNIRKINQDVPLILFSYLNPLWHSLQTSFWNDAQKAGIDGVLMVDCPLEESIAFKEQSSKHGIALIYVIAPSTPVSRIKKMDKAGEGFLYYATRKGTTGIRAHLPEDFEEKIKAIKSVCRLPVLAGFGISSRKTAKHALKHADGLVIGSLFVKALQANTTLKDLTALVQKINPLIL